MPTPTSPGFAMPFLLLCHGCRTGPDPLLPAQLSLSILPIVTPGGGKPSELLVLARASPSIPSKAAVSTSPGVALSIPQYPSILGNSAQFLTPSFYFLLLLLFTAFSWQL